MPIAVDTCGRALLQAARIARRRRLRALGRHYDRARDLPHIAAEFASRPGHPLATLTPEAMAGLRRADARLTRRIARALVRRVRSALAERDMRNVEARLDRLRIALAGEWSLYQRQRSAGVRREAA